MADTGFTQELKVVKSIYNFKGQNNDELCFSKGDIITVTQMVDGGWWEGTLNGRTGWFPSNYTKEVKIDSRAGAKSPTGRHSELLLDKRESILFYRNIVTKDLIDTEKVFLGEIQSLWTNYLSPLQDADILQKEEYRHLCGNIEDTINLHQSLLSALEEDAKLPESQQRVGGLFIKEAPAFKSAYSSYCSNHPHAVIVLQKRREELNKFMENKGTNGILFLTSQLSKPFSRLEKYQNILKELERHTEDSHMDRGNTQRAMAVYRELAMGMVDLRKRKQIELDIMGSSIRGWEGEEISQLGACLLLGQMGLHTEDGERDRLFLLFPSVLVILSISPRMSAYIFQEKIVTAGLTVNPLEDSENCTNAFEITGGGIDRHAASCHNKHDQIQWIEMLRQQARASVISSKFTKPQSLQISSSPVNMSAASQAKVSTVVAQQPHRALKTTTWTISCLRPSAPSRPPLLFKDDPLKSPRGTHKNFTATKRKAGDDTKVLEDDALLLQVIEAYCTSAKTRHTVNSSLFDMPQVLIAEEEKIIVEETKGNQTVVEERTLVDTVYSLKDTVKDLKNEQIRLRRDLEDESRARRRLETMIRKSMKSLVETSSGTRVFEESFAFKEKL